MSVYCRKTVFPCLYAVINILSVKIENKKIYNKKREILDLVSLFPLFLLDLNQGPSD